MSDTLTQMIMGSTLHVCQCSARTTTRGCLCTKLTLPHILMPYDKIGNTAVNKIVLN